MPVLTRDGKVRIEAWLPPDLLRDLKRVRAETDEPMSRIIEEALRKELALRRVLGQLPKD